MEFNYEEYLEKHQRTALAELEYDYDKLSPEQRELILQPSDAPENFHCDGEITPNEALANWKRKLKASGFTALEVHKITLKIIG